MSHNHSWVYDYDVTILGKTWAVYRCECGQTKKEPV